MFNRPLIHSICSVKSLFMASLLTALVACGGGGAKSPSTDTPTPPTPTSKVAALELKRSSATVKSDNSDSSTITVTASDTNGAVVSGATVQFSTATGTLSPGAVVTDAQGKATVDFSSGFADISTRTATITASANGASKQIPILISGSTMDVTSNISTLPDNGTSTATLTVLVKDAGGNSAPDIPVTLAQSGGGGVSFSPTTGATNSNGNFITTVSGVRPGSVNVSVTAIGLTRTQAYAITPTSTNSFSIDQQTLNSVVIANNDITPITIGDSLQIRVNAPAGVTQVVFATSQGKFNGLGPVTFPAIPVVSGKATATFTSMVSGVSSIQVFDPNNQATSTDNLTVAVTSAATSAKKITLQAAPSNVGVSLGGTLSTSSLIATVTDINGNPVGGAAVAFEVVTGTGGGESVSPVVQLSSTTAAQGLTLGQARVTFTSGSLPSSQGGVKIRASVVGASSPVQTRDASVVPPDPTLCAICGVDAAITIGGAPASIAIGQPSDFTDSADKTQYIFPMSVTVSDASNKGVPGVVVSLSAFPIAWSTAAIGCFVDGDDNVSRGTFYNEDNNEDFILDATSEDGVRIYYKDGTASPPNATGPSTKDNKITSPPADGGVLPSTATTDANGIASFNLIYPKSSALHIINRVRASTIVQGTETVGELRFRLPALKIDAPDDPKGCKLPRSPYVY